MKPPNWVCPIDALYRLFLPILPILWLLTRSEIVCAVFDEQGSYTRPQAIRVVASAQPLIPMHATDEAPLTALPEANNGEDNLNVAENNHGQSGPGGGVFTSNKGAAYMDSVPIVVGAGKGTRRAVLLGVVTTVVAVVATAIALAVYFATFASAADDHATGAFPEPTYTPTAVPTLRPTMLPTAEPTAIPDPLIQMLSASIPAAVTETVDSHLPEPAARLSAYLGASVAIGAISAVLEGRNDSSTVADLRDDMMRMTQCAYYAAGGNATDAENIIATALYSSITSEEAAWAFMGFYVSPQVTVSAVSSSSVDAWADTCDALISKLNATSTGFPRQNGTVANARLTPAQHSGGHLRGHDDRLLPRIQKRMRDAAGEAEEQCGGGDGAVDVIYINGILCSPDESDSGATALTLMIAAMNVPSFTAATAINVFNVRNPSEGFVLDLWECIKLKALAMTFDEVLRLIISLRMKNQVLEAVAFAALDELAEIIPMLRDRVLEKVIAYTPGTVEQDILSKVRTSLTHGRAVVLVGHSQGNLYMNSAYHFLTEAEKENVKLLSVATPASSVGEPGTTSPYVTRYDDLVVVPVPGSLIANVHSPSESWTMGEELGILLNHNFIRCYMSDQNTAAYVHSALRAQLLVSEPPEAVAGDGIITVTLRWGENEDVDLHVWEPSGYHVYYSQKQGPSGYLDVDDVTSYGPENYYVACSTLQAGRYLVALRYYDGVTAETARVALSAGSQIRQVTKTLTEIGSSSAMVNVAHIDVNLDNPSRPTFQITLL